MKRVGIAGTVGALVVPADDFGHARPGKLYPADDLMAESGMVGDFAKLLGIKGAGLAEQRLIQRHLADVVQISCRTKRGEFRRVEAESLADPGRVTAYSQGMAAQV